MIEISDNYSDGGVFGGYEGACREIIIYQAAMDFILGNYKDITVDDSNA